MAKNSGNVNPRQIPAAQRTSAHVAAMAVAAVALFSVTVDAVGPYTRGMTLTDEDIKAVGGDREDWMGMGAIEEYVAPKPSPKDLKAAKDAAAKAEPAPKPTPAEVRQSFNRPVQTQQGKPNGGNLRPTGAPSNLRGAPITAAGQAASVDDPAGAESEETPAGGGEVVNGENAGT